MPTNLLRAPRVLDPALSVDSNLIRYEVLLLFVQQLHSLTD